MTITRSPFNFDLYIDESVSSTDNGYPISGTLIVNVDAPYGFDYSHGFQNVTYTIKFNNEVVATDNISWSAYDSKSDAGYFSLTLRKQYVPAGTYNVSFTLNGGTQDYTGDSMFPTATTVNSTLNFEPQIIEPTEHYYGFSGNGGTIPEVGEGYGGYTVQYGEEFTIDECDFKRPGYEFVNWNTRSDGTGTSYDPGVYVWNIDDEYVTFYAQWKPLTGRMYQKQGDSFVSGIPWIKVSGVWEKGIPWVNKHGTWYKSV